MNGFDGLLGGYDQERTGLYRIKPELYGYDMSIRAEERMTEMAHHEGRNHIDEVCP